MTQLYSYNYGNITISGLPGCGSTTLLSLLREHLQFDGWKAFSGGQFMRAYAEEKGLFEKENALHHSALVYGDEFDRQVDMGMREKLMNEEKWLLESWLSGFMAQNVPGVLKILLVCSDDSVRVDRIVNRDKVSVSDAKIHLQERYEANLEKWSRMYHQEWKEWVVETGKLPASDAIDFWRPELYDKVIDTYSTNQQETYQIVVDAITKEKTAGA